MNRPFKLFTAALIALGLALPAAALACPGGKGGKGGKGMMKMIEKNADRLGIDEATAQQIKGVLEANKAQSESLRADVKAAREALKEAMQAPSPNKAQVMQLSEELGAARTAAQQHRMAVKLDVQALLTPEQREAVQELREQRRERRKARRGKRGKRGGGDWGGADEG